MTRAAISVLALLGSFTPSSCLGRGGSVGWPGCTINLGRVEREHFHNSPLNTTSQASCDVLQARKLRLQEAKPPVWVTELPSNSNL